VESRPTCTTRFAENIFPTARISMTMELMRYVHFLHISGDNTDMEQYAATWSPLHRVGLPIDVARVVCFLASQDGEWINGKVLGIDGAACM
jgi:NAD(P)-dependent dehydrogenase (short-subunit alcohol dehydrogenase family)